MPRRSPAPDARPSAASFAVSGAQQHLEVPLRDRVLRVEPNRELELARAPSASVTAAPEGAAWSGPGTGSSPRSATAGRSRGAPRGRPRPTQRAAGPGRHGRCGRARDSRIVRCFCCLGVRRTRALWKSDSIAAVRNSRSSSIPSSAAHPAARQGRLGPPRIRRARSRATHARRRRGSRAPSARHRARTARARRRRRASRPRQARRAITPSSRAKRNGSAHHSFEREQRDRRRARRRASAIENPFVTSIFPGRLRARRQRRRLVDRLVCRGGS